MGVCPSTTVVVYTQAVSFISMLERIRTTARFIFQAAIADTPSIKNACRYRVTTMCDALAQSATSEHGATRYHRALLESVREQVANPQGPLSMPGRISLSDSTARFRQHVMMDTDRYTVESANRFPYVDARPKTMFSVLFSIKWRQIWHHQFPDRHKDFVDYVRDVHISSDSRGDNPSVHVLMYPDGASLRRELRQFSRQPGQHVQYPGDLRTIQIGVDDADGTVWRTYRRLGEMTDDKGKVLVWASFEGAGAESPLRERHTRRVQVRQNAPKGAGAVWR